MMRVAAIGVVLAAFTARAWGAADGPAAERPGRVLFQQAEAKFNVGRFEEALLDYQAAYDVEPLPAFLFDIGQCYRNLGNYERAQFFFRRYTALDPRSPNRPAAERLIAEMDRLTAEPASVSGGNQQTPSSMDISTLPAPAGDRPAATPPAAFAARPVRAAAAPPAPPVYRRTGFWLTVSAVVVAGGVAAAFALGQDDPRSSLRPIDTR
jgi:tetratricopeptide (TPR) repeat protein